MDIKVHLTWIKPVQCLIGLGLGRARMLVLTALQSDWIAQILFPGLRIRSTSTRPFPLKRRGLGMR